MVKLQDQSIFNDSVIKRIGKVGVLYGGLSNEREVSLAGGKAVYDALLEARVEAVLIDVKSDFLQIAMEKP
ncbi:MAG: hypothetical protein ACWIPH_07530, partial [Ostreibacterium sp.]